MDPDPIRLEDDGDPILMAFIKGHQVRIKDSTGIRVGTIVDAELQYPRVVVFLQDCKRRLGRRHYEPTDANDIEFLHDSATVGATPQGTPHIIIAPPDEMELWVLPPGHPAWR